MGVILVPRGEAPRDALFLAIQRCGSGSTSALFGSQRFRRQHVFPRNQVPAVDLDRHFVFAIVRNPWARMHSMWRWVVRLSLGRAPDGPPRISFRDWVLRYRYKPHKVDTDNPRLSGLGMNQVPQLEWLLSSRGERLDDRVFRFEEGLPAIWSAIEQMGYRRRQVWTHEDPRIHRTPSARWQQDYTPELVQRVAELYAPDIEAFGYSFP